MPKQYRTKRVRGDNVITIDKQIILWREGRKPKVIIEEKVGQRIAKKAAKNRITRRKPLGFGMFE